ncbi:MAG: adenylosuccinate synthetase [Acidimicrobiia bacterium]|nr:adenylosuccinate synthetase [Acidimicrobiia bacterium]
MSPSATARIVVDLGFGDSGKGLTVDHLVEQAPDTSLVVRFSGGHQVGHTVVRGGRCHTFSNFGAGTLLGAPTYYLPDTTLFPPAALLERRALTPVEPEVLVHPLAMVTTTYDVAWNQATERVNRHGSCGVGFGATVERHQKGIALYAKDLTNSWVTGHKLAAVNAYYRARAAGSAVEAAYETEVTDLDDEVFAAIGRQFIETVTLVTADGLPADRPNLVFEGSQGIMLDQIHGIFPHVTRADTTSKGALALLRSIGWADPVDIHYVTRCYQTRHGNGPMSSIDPVALGHTEAEANVTNRYQGEFRTAELDLDLINYALTTDAAHHGGFTVRKHLIVTCLDQRPDVSVELILAGITTGFVSVSTSHGPDAGAVKTVDLVDPITGGDLPAPGASSL